MKTCNRCRVEKALECFAKNGSQGRHTVCKPCRCDIERERRAADPERIRAQERARGARNVESRKRASRNYYLANKAELVAREHARYAEKSEAIRAQRKEYRAANPEKIRFHNGTRRAALRQAMPMWADRSEIKAVYARASALWAETGIPHHVDHEIPLKHPLVCGLHVPANLQVLNGADNIRKGNRFEIGD